MTFRTNAFALRSWGAATLMTAVLGACGQDATSHQHDHAFCGGGEAGQPQPAPITPEAAASPPSDEQLIAPLRIHVLSSDVSAALDSTMTDEELEERMVEVNRIWQQANIRFEVESIRRVSAAGAEGFQALIDSEAKKAGPLLGKVYAHAERLSDGWNVVIIEDFGAMPPGVYSCSSQVVVAARYFGMPSKEAPNTVLAHELGHALGLPHLCGEGENLMCANGQQPEALNEQQVARARAQVTVGQPAQCAP